MEEFHKGDIVGRKSYGVDIYFKIVNFSKYSDGRKCANLKGVYTRLCASAPMEDLVRIESGAQMARLREISLKSNEQMAASLPGGKGSVKCFGGERCAVTRNSPKKRARWKVLMCPVLSSI